MKQKLTLRRVLASAVAALAAAAAVWLLCRWVGYDLQLRIGNELVYEIANDDYTQIISGVTGNDTVAYDPSSVSTDDYYDDGSSVMIF